MSSLTLMIPITLLAEISIRGVWYFVKFTVWNFGIDPIQSKYRFSIASTDTDSNTRAARFIAWDSHVYLISKDGSVINSKSPSTVFK